MDKEKQSMIDKLNLAQIKNYLIKKYDFVISKEEIKIIEKQAELTYKMIKENKNTIQENGVTYYLNEDIKEYLEDKLIKE